MCAHTSIVAYLFQLSTVEGIGRGTRAGTSHSPMGVKVRKTEAAGVSKGRDKPSPISVKVRKTGQGKGEKADKEMPV